MTTNFTGIHDQGSTDCDHIDRLTFIKNYEYEMPELYVEKFPYTI